jgi:hypothetical protein
MNKDRVLAISDRPLLLPSPPARSRIFWCERPERRDTTPQDTVYGCRIEGREEAGMMIETSLKKKITRNQKREKNK